MVHKDDVAATIELFYHFLVSLNFDELEAEGLFGSSYSIRAAKGQSADGSGPIEALSLERDGHAR